MDRIILKDFETLACHGVNPEEKINKQRFLITADIGLDFREAARTDALSLTVSYSDVKKTIKAFVEDNSFDLIETLATRLAKAILLRFDRAQEVQITVKKPDAPMSGKFEYAAVRTSLSWRRAYLALGSNLGDRKAALDFAISSLKGSEACKNVRESSRIATTPYGGVATQEFLNSAVELDTFLTPHELLALAMSIEKTAGRTRDVHWGDRTLDIDILFYGDDVVDDPDLCIPHADMANRAFVLAPLAELAPNKVHPLLKKSVRAMLNELN